MNRLATVRSLSFLFLHEFRGNANISAAIKTGVTVVIQFSHSSQNQRIIATAARLTDTASWSIQCYMIKQTPLLLKEYGADAPITISGVRLNWGTDIQDYSVIIGLNGSCRVTSLSTNQLACQPPAEEPDHNPNLFEYHKRRKVPNVKVSLKLNHIINESCLFPYCWRTQNYAFLLGNRR